MLSHDEYMADMVRRLDEQLEAKGFNNPDRLPLPPIHWVSEDLPGQDWRRVRRLAALGRRW